MTIIIGLISIALAFISFPAVVELFMCEFGSDEFKLLLANESLKFLPYFVVSTATIIALLTYLREKAKFKNENKENRSKIFLELAKEGLEGAYDMLKDQNNNRITWIRASRDILHSLNLVKEIKSSQYLEAYRLFEEKVRHKLYLALTILDKKTGNRKPLPPQFFYGITDWNEGKDLKDIVIETSHKIKAESLSINRNHEEPHSPSLSVDSVVTVYDFLKYPEDYDDPLKKVKNWCDQWEYSNGVIQGAKRYVSHRGRYHAFNGKLFDKEKGD